MEFLEKPSQLQMKVAIRKRDSVDLGISLETIFLFSRGKVCSPVGGNSGTLGHPCTTEIKRLNIY